jgi:hypothetical protein
MKKLYVVTKYVEANSVADALRLAQRAPVHEVSILSQWWDKQGYQFSNEPKKPFGIADKKLTPSK